MGNHSSFVEENDTFGLIFSKDYSASLLRIDYIQSRA